MTKKFILCFIFFALSPLTLFTSMFLLDKFNTSRILGESISFSPNSGRVFSSFDTDSSLIASTIISDDSLPIMIENYLRRYQSPLLPFKDKIIDCSRKYGVQPQLIIAIAQQESNLGKKSPENCFNAWGWGIHAQGTTCFADWEEAIETVVKGIAKAYCAKGYCEDPCVMMKKYTPKSNGSWCAGVKQFLGELETGDF